MGGRRIDIGGGRAAPGPRRNAAERGGGAEAEAEAEAEAGEVRRGGGGLEVAVGSKEVSAGDGHRCGGSRRRGAEERHAAGRSEDGGTGTDRPFDFF
jgi:hypothetical protein